MFTMRIVASCLGLVVAGCVAAPAADEPDATASTAQAVTAPNDPYYANQAWNLNMIQVPAAWNVTTGSSSTLVAVIDGGKLPHPDLNAKWSGGWDFFLGMSDPTDWSTYHHGTHVAGIIGASANNATGVAGICWGCALMPILAHVERSDRLISASAPGVLDHMYGTWHVLANSIRYAAGLTVNDGNGHSVTAPRRADVMNISIGNGYVGAGGCPTELQQAINAAVAAGTTVVVAAGNATGDSSHADDWVADHYIWGTCSNVVLVTAVDPTGHLAAYASSGSHVTLAAPGGAASGNLAGTGATVGCPTDPLEPNPSGTAGVFSTWATSSGGLCYRYWAGTSMATPHVTGVVALMKSVGPTLTPAQITMILTQTATPVAGCSASHCGAGLVNAGAAVQDALISVTPTCTASGQHFTCTATATGFPPFTWSWQSLLNSMPTTSTTMPTESGYCASGEPTVNQVTVTDAFGRSATRVVQSSCP